MARARAAVRGRDHELTALRTALAPEGGRLIVLKGPAGIGRTTLLDAVGRMLVSEGIRVLPLRLGVGPDSDGDAFALAALVRTVRERFEQFHEAGLTEALSTVARLRDAGGQDNGGWTPSMVAALGILFDTIGRQARIAVLADDAHAVADPAPVLTAARRSGCLVVATCAEGAERGPGLAELLTVADQVMTIGPLADDVAESLVRRVMGARLDEGVPTALRTALGPLSGSPGTVLSTLEELRRSGRLIAYRGRLCLRAPAEPVALPADHPLLRHAALLGDLALRLLGAVAVLDGLGVDDLPLLAETLGTDPADCGRLLDQLIEAGVLTADPAGLISCRCPALAATVAGRAGARWGIALHASIAERLLSRHRRYGGVDPVSLADHIARGGAAVTLEDDTVGWLVNLSAAVEPDEPERAALWCSAALRHLPPKGPEHNRTLIRLLALVVRTGQYELLREVLTRYAEQGCADDALAEISLAAALVALHTGELPPERAVRSLLDAPFSSCGPTGFSEWWFGRRLVPGARQPLHPASVGAIRAGAERMGMLGSALSGDIDACERAWRSSDGTVPSPVLDHLLCATSVADMARLMPGARYQVPVTGVLGAYHRVVRGYADADWTQAMSAVRELELSGVEDTLAHHAARLFAADMCAARGEFGQGAQWLATATPAPRLAVMRTWVRVGLADRMGDDGRAVRLALLAGPRLRRAGLHTGLYFLLSRAVRIAVTSDDHEGAAELLAEIELLPQEEHADARESLLLARGLARRDLGWARSATDLTRERGDLPALLESCLAIARFAEDPRPWLREAHTLATQCGASVLLERIRQMTRERGVPAPRTRGRRDAPAVTEQRIIELIGEGLTNRQIALRLQLSEKTVENYLTRLFARTGCRSRVELAAASLSGRLTWTTS